MSQRHQYPQQFRGGRKHGDKRIFGLLVILAGVALMLKKLDLFYFDWHSFWPVILIAIGLFIGVQNKFRKNVWWVLILIGTAHLIPEFIIPGTNVSSSSLVFPLALIIGGLFIVFRSKKRMECHNDMQIVTNNESSVSVDVTFGGRKEIVTSKNFKGGSVQVMFGGCELNLIQADGTQPMVLDIKVSFGGLELIVPAHWELQNEIDPTFGSIEDERSMRQTTATDENKRLLILRGSCTCGGIEIKSY